MAQKLGGEQKEEVIIEERRNAKGSGNSTEKEKQRRMRRTEAAKVYSQDNCKVATFKGFFGVLSGIGPYIDAAAWESSGFSNSSYKFGRLNLLRSPTPPPICLGNEVVGVMSAYAMRASVSPAHARMSPFGEII